MTIERRSEDNKVPHSPNDILNEMQLLTLHNMEKFGWSLAFIRRPLFQEIVPVLRHCDSMKVGTMDADGTMNAYPDISFR